MTNGSSDSSKRGNRAGMRDLGHALGFLRQHRRIAAIAIISLLLSIGAQLMVPQAVQNSLDAITDGLMLQQAGDLSPAEQQALAEAQGIPLDSGADLAASILRAFIVSLVLIVVFSIVRGVFAFAQAFMAEKPEPECGV